MQQMTLALVNQSQQNNNNAVQAQMQPHMPVQFVQNQATSPIQNASVTQ